MVHLEIICQTRAIVDVEMVYSRGLFRCMMAIAWFTLLVLRPDYCSSTRPIQLPMLPRPSANAILAV